MIDSKALAASLEATAKEIAACAALYQRMSSGQVNLAAGLGALKDRLDDEYRAFILTAVKEIPNATQK